MNLQRRENQAAIMNSPDHCCSGGRASAQRIRRKGAGDAGMKREAAAPRATGESLGWMQQKEGSAAKQARRRRQEASPCTSQCRHRWRLPCSDASSLAARTVRLRAWRRTESDSWQETRRPGVRRPWHFASLPRHGQPMRMQSLRSQPIPTRSYFEVQTCSTSSSIVS